jgi:hypothetical protein
MKSNMRLPTGNLLRAARCAAGLKQVQLGKSANLDTSTISRMEGAGTKAVGGPTRNLLAVLDALRAHGVEVLDDGLRLVPKGRRR